MISWLAPLADHVWQSTLFAGVAGLLTLALRKNPARIRYWLWMAASVKFLIPFALFVAIGSFAGEQSAPATIQPAMTGVVEEITQSLRPAEAMAPLAVPTTPASNRMPALLLGGWALGFLGVSASWRLRWKRVNAAVRAGSPMQFDIPVPVISTPELFEPGVFGIAKPVLLLPQGIRERLTPEQLEAIIVHEFCHVRRRDNLFAAVHMFVEAIFWFHPLVWWIRTRLAEERERACDEEVLRLGCEPRAYAQSILKVCELYLESPLACVAGVSGSNLRKRIEAIVRNELVLRLGLLGKAVLAIAGTTVVVAPIVIGILNLPVIRAQSVPAGTPKWEAVSIRPCESQGLALRGGRGPTPGRLYMGCLSVSMLIEQAYVQFEGGQMNVAAHPTPIEGGPPWIKSDEFTITAKAEGTPRVEMLNGPMLQRILEDRFKLKIHRATRDIPVYALTVAKGGPKLQPPEECIPIDLTAPPRAEPLRELPRLCGMSRMGAPKGSNLAFDFYGVSLAQFSRLLNVDRPVIDKTGITGRFDIHLECAFDDTTRGAVPANAGDFVPPEDPTGGASIFTAVQQQLGLKLEPTKGPGEFLVIDRVERPTEN